MKLINITADEIFQYAKYGSPYGNGGLFHIDLGESFYTFQTKIGFGGKGGGWNVVEDYELLEDRYVIENAGVPYIYDKRENIGDKSGLNVLFLFGVSFFDGFLFNDMREFGRIRVVACGIDGDYLNLVLKVPETLQFSLQGTVFDCYTGSLVAGDRNENVVTLEEYFDRTITLTQKLIASWRA